MSRLRIKTAIVVGSLLCLIGQVAQASPILIQNASFENATGYWAEGTPPSSWAVTFTNLADSSGSTASDSYVTVVANSPVVPNQDGSNYLDLNLDVGPTAISGKTVTSWTSTSSLGTYQASTVYTLTVAQTAILPISSRFGIIALATNNTNAGIVASKSTAFDVLNPTGNPVFHDYQTVLDTSLNPAVVGQPIIVQLVQQATDGAIYGKVAMFDNVRLDAVSTSIPEPASLGMGLLGLGIIVLGRRRAQQSA